MTKSVSVMVMVAVAMFLFAGGVGSARDIKERMKERLPQLAALKAKGVVGENNQGYLQFMGAAREGEAVVAAENADRRMVYETIAKEQGTTAELVGQRRALQLSGTAAPGEWLQNSTGQWHQKK